MGVIEDNLNNISEWAVNGVAEKDMAEMLGISYSTFRRAKKENKKLFAILEAAKTEHSKILSGNIRSVEESLFKRCLGYNAKVLKNYKIKKNVVDASGQVVCDTNGKPLTNEEIEQREEETHIPADVGAIKFYLMNRAKADWLSDPERLELERKRVKNDTKRTKIAENAQGGSENVIGVEEYLEEIEVKGVSGD